MHRTVAVLASAALALASCDSGDDAPAPPAPTFLEGDWTGCATAATSLGELDVKATLSFAGDQYQYDAIGYATADGTCGGVGFLVETGSGTFAVGPDLQATLGPATVTARAVDLHERRSGATYLAVAYLDAGAEPDVLYVSELAADGAARPTVLEESAPLRRMHP